jgi:hypothetical protein
MFFDPAMRFTPFGLIAWEQTEVPGIRLSKEGGTFTMTTQPKCGDAVIERKADLALAADGSLSGKFQIAYKGQEALRRRVDAVDDDDAARRKSVEDELKGWLPSAATLKLDTIQPWEGSEEPLKVEGTVQIAGVGTPVGRRLMLPVGVFQMNPNYPFESVKRIYPIYFRYPYQHFDEITIQLPAGFQVDSLPQPRRIGNPIGQFELLRVGQPGNLKLQRRLVMEHYIYQTKDYPSVRNFFQAVRSYDEEQVVLRAAESGK